MNIHSHVHQIRAIQDVMLLLQCATRVLVNRCCLQCYMYIFRRCRELLGCVLDKVSVYVSTPLHKVSVYVSTPLHKVSVMFGVCHFLLVVIDLVAALLLMVECREDN